MTVYNDTWMNNATNLVHYAIGIGNMAGSPFLFGNLILLAFFLIFLVMSYRLPFREVLVIDAFITTILAVLLFFAELTSATTIAYPFGVFFLSLLFYMFS